MRPVRVMPIAVSLLALAGCGSDKSSASDGSIAVTATDTSCEIAKTTLPAGKNVLKVTNDGAKVTELYVYGAGDKVVTERENIGPGTTVELTVELPAGTYSVACKPGMKGDIAGAKALFAPSRVGWETIEPVAESFGDIDPKVDTREADLEKGQAWTGWHRLEKDLWVKKSVAGD